MFKVKYNFYLRLWRRIERIIRFLILISFIFLRKYKRRHFSFKLQLKLVRGNNSSTSHKVWSTDMESAIDSSFFWGYLITQIPGGFLASFFPSNRIFGAAIFGSSICNLFIPLSIYLSPYILIIVRILQGLVEVSWKKIIFFELLANKID